MKRHWALSVTATLLIAACGDGGDGDKDRPGRGSAACRNWQDAICDLEDNCDGLPRELCDEDYQGVTCLSDAMATSCATRLRDGCRITESEYLMCDIEAIADPLPAQAACDEFVERVCAHFVACGQSPSETECVAATRLEAKCDDAIAVSLRFEDCMRDVEALECPDVALPASCATVIKVPLSAWLNP